MSADGTGPRRRLGIGASPVWAPRGNSIAFFQYVDCSDEPCFRVAIGDANRGPAHPVRAASSAFPLWAPDGTKLAFTLGGCCLGIADTHGRVRGRVRVRRGRNRAFAWSADEKRIAVVHGDPEPWRSGLYVTAGGRTTAVVPGGDFLDVRWSPDGRRLSFGSLEVFGSAVAGDKARPTSGHGSYAPAWSPDGSRLAFVSDTGAPLSWFGSKRDVWIVNADGSGLRDLSRGKVDDGPGAWSPDGSRLAFIGSDPETGGVMQIVDPGSRALRTFAVPGAEGGDIVTWSPDGRQLLYSTSRGPHLVNADGGDDHPLLDPDNAYAQQPQLSPDGKLIAFARVDSLWTMDALGQNQHEVAHFNGRFVDDLSWAPDGSSLAVRVQPGQNDWITPARHDIWRVRADGTGRKLLARFIFLNGRPSWSADGRSVVFAGAPTMVSDADVYRVPAAGGRIRALTRDARWETSAAVSGGKTPRIAYVVRSTTRDGKSDIWILDPATGSKVDVTG